MLVLRRRLIGLQLVVLHSSWSDSDSGTVSRTVSFLWQHVQRPPWLQQQLSAGAHRVSRRVAKHGFVEAK